MTETYAEVSSRHEWRDPISLWRILSVCYVAMIALWVTLAATEAFAFALYFRLVTITDKTAATFDLIVPMLNQIVLPALVICAIITLLLTYGLVANAHARGPTTKLTGPVLAVVAYFIPLLSLFMPPLIMAELWRASFGPSGR